MGLRCSVFGHTFSETDTRRDREVRGDEVVTVVKTIERCSSCGAERVVSENKEVVSVVDAGDIDEATAERAGTETDEETDDTAEATDAAEPTETVDAAEPTEASETDAPEDAAESADAPAEGSDEAPEAPDLDPDADPEEEDVEFITETDGSLGGGDEVDVDPDADVPEGGIGGMAARSGAYGSSDEASDPVPDTGEGATDEDAEILGQESQPRSERAPGQWPDDPDATDEPWKPGELGGGPGTEPEPNEEVPEPAPVEPSPSPGARPDGDGESESLHCPNCAHTVSTDGSYRAGDACPECRAGYLESASE